MPVPLARVPGGPGGFVAIASELLSNDHLVSRRVPALAYRIEFTPQADEHLAALAARDRATLLARVGRQLVHQPMVETRNRKPMRPNPLAPWELRIGHLRVYYDVKTDPPQVVTVRAIGVKVGNRVRVGEEWWDLSRAEEAAGEP